MRVSFIMAGAVALTRRLGTATAVAVITAPLAAGCNFQQDSNPLGPMEVQVYGGPDGAVTARPSPAPAANRAADPPEGHRLPLPDMAGVTAEVGARHPDALRGSCGNWEFMDLLVDELRRHDTRWGYNWKRGNVGDPSHDVIAYHWGGGHDEGSTEVYLIDVIAGHCGDNPSPSWFDVTDATYGAGTVGRWTGRGRF